MASQVFNWTLQLVRKLKLRRKSKHHQSQKNSRKAVPVRVASISRPSLPRPAEHYAQSSRPELEPLPYPWTEADHLRRSEHNGSPTTHHYPHIYFRNGQYHTTPRPHLASSPPRTPSPIPPQLGPSTAPQRSFTYPTAGSPRIRPSPYAYQPRSEVWWTTEQPRPGSPRGVGGPRSHPGDGKVSPHRNATPGPSRPPQRSVPLPATPALPPAEPPGHPAGHLAGHTGQAQVAPGVAPVAHTKHRHKRHDKKKHSKKREKSKKSKGKEPVLIPPSSPPLRLDPSQWSPGKTPPAIQQILHAQRVEERARYKAMLLQNKPPPRKPTAIISVTNGYHFSALHVDPRHPPPEFPYEQYLVMRKAQVARERRLREREEKLERERGLIDRILSKISSQWPMLWKRKTSRSQCYAPQDGRKIR